MPGLIWTPWAELGADRHRLHTLRNGVDLQRFVPERPRAQARQRLGLPVDGRCILSVGHLIEAQSHPHRHQALSHLPGVTLLIMRLARKNALETLAKRHGRGRHALGGRGAPDRPEVVVQRRRCAGPYYGNTRRGWANDAAGGHGLRHPGAGHQHLGHAGW